MMFSVTESRRGYFVRLIVSEGLIHGCMMDLCALLEHHNKSVAETLHFTVHSVLILLLFL